MAVLGAGTMGCGIAQRLAQEGLEVVLVDNDPRAVTGAQQAIKASLDDAESKKILTSKEAKAIVKRILIRDSVSDLSQVDLIIEAIFEDVDAKLELFGVIEKICPKHTVLCSNTSSLSIERLAKAIKRPERFIGLHFFYHPARNRLVEVVPWKGTSEHTVRTVLNFARQAGLVPLLVKDSPGFAVNRLFVPWLNEATRLVEDFVADIPTIEEASKQAFGIPIGPFELMNRTGIPIAFHSAESLKGLDHYYGPSRTLQRQFLLKRLWDCRGKIDKGRFDKVQARLYAVVFHEAGSLLDEGVATLEDIERGARIGLRWEWGPFGLMNHLGCRATEDIMRIFYDKHSHLKMPSGLRTYLVLKKPWAFRFVEMHRDRGIAYIVINRPETMNAINDEVLAQIEDRFLKADRDKKVKAIVIQGVGKAFMAGADIKFFIDRIEAGRIDDIVSLTVRAHALAERIERSNKLVIAKLDGVAVGGGAELAMVADVVVASPRARIGFPETGIGLYPGLGGTQRLPRLVGKELAKYLIFTGCTVDASTALDLGLVQYLVPSEKLDEFISGLVSKKKISRLGCPSGALTPKLRAIRSQYTDEKVKKMLSDASAAPSELSNKAPVALRLSNMLIDEGLELSLEDGLALERAHLKEVFSTKDALIGLRSVGRERPVFHGE